MWKDLFVIIDGMPHRPWKEFENIMDNNQQHTRGMPRDFTFHLLEQITNKFSKDSIIGYGGYGVVYNVCL